MLVMQNPSVVVLGDLLPQQDCLGSAFMPDCCQ
jgi:hypothetical protein